MNQLHLNGIDVKNISSIFQKVQLVKLLEQKYEIDFLKEVGANNGDMDDDFYNLIKRTFRLRNAKPTTVEQVNALYASMFRSITGDNTLVHAGKKGITTNKALFKHHLELNQLKNKNCVGFSSSTIEVFNIQVQTVPLIAYHDELDIVNL